MNSSALFLAEIDLDVVLDLLLEARERRLHGVRSADAHVEDAELTFGLRDRRVHRPGRLCTASTVTPGSTPLC